MRGAVGCRARPMLSRGSVCSFARCSSGGGVESDLPETSAVLSKLSALRGIDGSVRSWSSRHSTRGFRLQDRRRRRTMKPGRLGTSQTTLEHFPESGPVRWRRESRAPRFGHLCDIAGTKTESTARGKAAARLSWRPIGGEGDQRSARWAMETMLRHFPRLTT